MEAYRRLLERWKYSAESLLMVALTTLETVSAGLRRRRSSAGELYSLYDFRIRVDEKIDRILMLDRME
jgi:hypothetical protein